MKIQNKIALIGVGTGAINALILNLISEWMEKKSLVARLSGASSSHATFYVEVSTVVLGILASIVASVVATKGARSASKNTTSVSTEIAISVLNSFGSFLVGFLLIGSFLPVR
jgi:hypothetical protein